jgi:hypothetical protein
MAADRRKVGTSSPGLGSSQSEFLTSRYSSLSSICCENPVPQAGKMPARLNVGVKSRRRPSAALLLNQRSLGPLTAAGVAGLRGIFLVDNGLLHRVSPQTLDSEKGPSTIRAARQRITLIRTMT